MGGDGIRIGKLADKNDMAIAAAGISKSNHCTIKDGCVIDGSTYGTFFSARSPQEYLMNYGT